MRDLPQPKVVILATGGTIAGLSADPARVVDYEVAALSADSLVAAVPALRDERLEVEQVAQIDSKDMDHATWLQLALRIDKHLRRPDVCGLVITHGTDTLEETAYFLHRVLSPRKPVVLTAAMRPANALLADGPQNLLDAVRLAQSHGRGVLACLLGRVYAPDDVRKVNGCDLDAFRSGGDGVIGRLVDGQLQRVREWPRCEALGCEWLPLDPESWPSVALLYSHAGAHPSTVEALLASGIDGLVVAGTGNGTVHSALMPSLLRAMEQGLAVCRASRCSEGGVVGVGNLPAFGRLSPMQSRIELMLQLMNPLRR